MQNSKEKTLSQRIAERIIKYILEENLQPGDKLPNETVMCERLNVGRSSLREAIRADETDIKNILTACENAEKLLLANKNHIPGTASLMGQTVINSSSSAASAS